MPKNVFSFELSSGGFSTGASAGVGALDSSFEPGAETDGEAFVDAIAGVAEPSAM